MSRLTSTLFFLLLCIGIAADGSCKSLDLETWHPRNNEGSGSFGDIAYGGGVFVAIGHDPAGTIWRSADGETWTNITSASISTALLSGATYGEGLFIVTGSGGEILSSPDGLTWTRQGASVTSATLSAATYGNGMFVAGGSTGRIVHSPNGIDWQEVLTDDSAWFKGLVYGEGLFVAVGDAGAIGTSPDGAIWTERGSEIADLTAVSYGNGMFIATGPGGLIVTSGDGITWTPSTLGTAEDLAGIHYFKGFFVIVGANGVILYSADGTDWFEADTEITANLTGITGGEYTFVTVGQLRSIYQSDAKGMLLPLMTAPISAK
jgi:hypothetical protein